MLLTKLDLNILPYFRLYKEETKHQHPTNVWQKNPSGASTGICISEKA